MRWMRGHLVSILLVLPILSACAPSTLTPTPTPSPPTPTQTPDICERCLREIVPDDWQEVDPRAVTVDKKPPDEECIVFYRAGDPSENPIDAVMYRLTSEEPPMSSDKTSSFVAYNLYSPYGGHVCEYKCEAERTELFSAYGGSELVIRDKCGDEWVRLLAYRWVTETLEYQLVAHFDGDRIAWGPDRVTVDEYTLGGAGLVFRCAYSPREGTPLFNEKEASAEGEIIFPDGLPDDVLTSPYPEVVVLAFYNHVPYTDTAVIQDYFAGDAWKSVGQCEDGKCGCTSSPIAHVRVLNMDIAESRQVMGRADQYCPPDQAITAAANLAFVTAETVCEYEGDSEESISVTWMLAWEGSGWRLQGSPAPSE